MVRPRYTVTGTIELDENGEWVMNLNTPSWITDKIDLAQPGEIILSGYQQWATSMYGGSPKITAMAWGYTTQQSFFSKIIPETEND